jgi:hypothetical protein
VDRLEANDLLMNAYFSSLKKQGINTNKIENIYTGQRVIIEAEEIKKKGCE